MTTTLTMIPLPKIRPSKANPRQHFDDERMAELVASVKRHGIITPSTTTTRAAVSHQASGWVAALVSRARRACAGGRARAADPRGITRTLMRSCARTDGHGGSRSSASTR